MPIESFSTDRPAFFVDGVARPPLDAGLIELLIEDSLTGPSSCHATFQNWGAGSGGVPSFLHFDRSVLDVGKPVRVDVPSGSGSGSLFEGFIDVLEADFPPGESPRISFAAIPTLHAFRTTPRSRSYSNQTDARVLKLIASTHGLTLHLSLDSAPVAVPNQKKVSDLAFVLGRARALGAEVWLVDRELHVHSTRYRPSAELQLTRGGNLIQLTGTWGAARTGRVTRGSDPFVVVAGAASHHGELRTGRRIRLQGVGPLFEGEYYVTRTSRRFSLTNGLVCAFDAERVAG
jgi:hypothetical protein